MSTISRTAVVPYSAEEMYALVNDIESYPQFLPWCTDASVQELSDTGLIASVALASGKLQHTFTTRNTMQPGRQIDVRLISGPFSHLYGTWKFEPVGTGMCRIDLHMNFEFRNKLLKLTLSPVFNQFIARLVGAFVDRAEKIYGRRLPC